VAEDGAREGEYSSGPQEHFEKLGWVTEIRQIRAGVWIKENAERQRVLGVGDVAIVNVTSIEDPACTMDLCDDGDYNDGNVEAGCVGHYLMCSSISTDRPCLARCHMQILSGPASHILPQSDSQELRENASAFFQQWRQH
jgi:hypothetical protein